MADEANSLYLVDADWLRAHRGDSTVVLDTRPGAAYWSGHLDGARHFDPFPFHHSDTTEAGLRNFREQLAWIFSAIGIRWPKRAMRGTRALDQPVANGLSSSRRTRRLAQL